MANQRIWRDCTYCLGTGVMYDRDNYAYLQNVEPTSPGVGSYVEVECPVCEGTKRVVWGWLEET